MSSTEAIAANAQSDAKPDVLPFTGLDLAFASFLQQTRPSTDVRHELLAALVSWQFGRGHACLDLGQLSRAGVAALGWDLRAAALLPQGLGAAAASLPWSQGPNSPLVLDGQRLYLRRNWSAEQSIGAAIEARLGQPCSLAADLSATLDLLFPPRAGAGAGPDWQKVACALASRQRLTLITGGPGTGKTTTVVRLLALLQADAARRGQTLRVALAAPTGKAAARLGESIASALERLPPALRLTVPCQAVTLHRLLQLRPGGQQQEVPQLAVDLVVVDEASMIDLEMMARLLAAVPLSASLVLLGDKDQLASVEAGAVMGQLCQSAAAGCYTRDTIDWVLQATGADLRPWAGAGAALAQQTVMLRHSHRFAGDSGIGLWARAVNEGDRVAAQTLWRGAPAATAQAVVAVQRLQPAGAGDPQWLAQIQQGWQEWRGALQGLNGTPCTDEQALQFMQSFASFQVLCAVREGPWGVEAMNRRIAASLGFDALGWFAGRPVMVTRNDYNLKLMNGDVGLCLPRADGLRVAFPDGQGGVRWVLPSRLDAVETVFAMTVHKSQGSEFEHVCLVLPDKSVAVLTRELLYTGITRARSRLTLVVPQESVLWRALETPVLRSGGLADLPDVLGSAQTAPGN